MLVWALVSTRSYWKELMIPKWKWIEKNIVLIRLIYKWLNGILNLCILIKYWRTTMLCEGIQHARMFRVSYSSRPTNLFDDLNEESVVSLRITICDAPRQMLTNVILLWILYMLCINIKYSNNINNMRKKEKFHLLLLLLR